MSLLLTSATLVDDRGERSGSWVLVDGDRIAEVGTTRSVPPSDETIDLAGAVVTPGLIDLHGHGGGGASFDDGGDAIRTAVDTHRAHGTTRSVLSLVANPRADLLSSLAGIAEIAAADPTILGSHLEGPFLAPDNRGAHHPDFLTDPDPSLVHALLDAAGGTLRQVTIAPELPGAQEAVRSFAGAGVRVALGHTVADYATARDGFRAGATLLTHAFNAMPGLHHRAPGPIAAALDEPGVTLELILDGVHVHPTLARILFEAAPGRVALVSDAMAAAGAPDGDYRLGSLQVTVDDGIARLAGTDTIAGSTLTLDRALALAVDVVGLSVPDAVGALTHTPARALGLDDELGRIARGYAADLVVWNPDWTARRVWAAGAVV